MELWNTAILVPCYKRPEYTARCLRALEASQQYPSTQFLLVDDGSCDETAQLLLDAKLPKEVIIRDGNLGLRHTLLEFIDWACEGRNYILGVVGNDCLVPAGFIDQMTLGLMSTNADILSPNVLPSNAAFHYGEDDIEGLGYRPSKIVGGLWFMRRRMVEGIQFEKVDLRGIAGATNVLDRIVLEKEPHIGWLPEVVVQDIGHWSGQHAEHIKSEAHREYSEEVGRQIVW